MPEAPWLPESPPAALLSPMPGEEYPTEHAGDNTIRATANPNRHRKLWELAEEYHCPVIGTCLNEPDLQAIARRVGLGTTGRNAFQLHLDAVSAAATRNAGSEAMQKRLNQKYAPALALFRRAKTDHQVFTLWKEHLARGEIAGALWAVVTHRAASTATCQEVYGDVHMLSHCVAAGQAAQARQADEIARCLDEERRRFARDSARQQHELARQGMQVRQLESALAAARQRARDVEDLRRRLEELESGAAMMAMGQRLMALTEEVARLREAARRPTERDPRFLDLERESIQLRRERDDLLAQRNALETLWSAQDGQEPRSSSGRGPECDGCSGPLNGHCVLCVGGRTPLLPQYREMARRLGIRLIHHDGGREEALSRLPDLLAASDAVICPTDCVGHMAYHQLKRHCKQAGKPCVLVNNSGLASFAAGLARLADGRAHIQRQDM